ncbi:hypothetical protein GCM10015535_68490 [Streptomyces gelaticus]|uniref:Serine/threonine protein kinase n=1 Tax=Streptomyces gelaticus TaxID=285446 RepID=A0ABQ2W9B4_9ACTN|nr:hypothetical protein [Streptomyces gelaticus]GGV97312.1 hypothetical protein GCM10015535_68490 [Streptomyces gelaticus]
MGEPVGTHDLLVARHGGHGPGARVRLANGRPAVVYATGWREAGAPVAYRIRELKPGRHGNVGKLVSSLTSDELVSRDLVAGDCRSTSMSVQCRSTPSIIEATSEAEQDLSWL